MDLSKYQQKGEAPKKKKRVSQPIGVKPRKEFDCDPVLITEDQGRNLSMDSLLDIARGAGIDADLRHLTMEEQHSVSYHWLRGTRQLAYKQADRFRRERSNRLKKLDLLEDIFA